MQIKFSDYFVASCNPRCMNGGSCIFHNLCQCPKSFRGPQCQYSADRCSITRTGFNGGYRCNGSDAETSCTIYCPEGSDYEFTPAKVYRCKYETGRFTPSIPKCVAGNSVRITLIIFNYWYFPGRRRSWVRESVKSRNLAKIFLLFLDERF